MKRAVFTIFITFVALTTPSIGRAATYTVDQVPNVHFADREQFVANPDDILSPAAVAQINEIFKNLRTSTSVEPMVVVVGAIEPNDPSTFATELFTAWGLGKSDVDNGLLLLVAVDQRKVEIRTGYGIEGALPDISCGRIIREVIVPAFREGNYNRGLVEASAVISSILSNPTTAAEYASTESDKDSASNDNDNAFAVYLMFCVMLTGFMLFLFVAKLLQVRDRSDYDKYKAFNPWKPVALGLSCAGLGMPLIVAIPLILLLNHWRNHKRCCPNCNAPMIKVDEINDNKFLTPSQDIEEQVGSVDYDVWLCEKCGETDILAYINGASPMIECDHCHARTAVLKVDRILRKPTATTEGLGIKEYECLNCEHRTNRPYKIDPDASGVIAAAGAAAILSGGRGGGGFGGGSFGGGFGGGMTGGGGAGGSW